MFAKLIRNTKPETHRIPLRKGILPRALVSSIAGYIKSVCVYLDCDHLIGVKATSIA